MILPSCDLLGIGLSVLDSSLYIDSHPQIDEKIEAHHSSESLGGPACIGTLTANRLGLSTVLISAIAKDYPGEFIRNKQSQFKSHSLIELETDQTPHATILVSSTGERSVIASLAKNVSPLKLEVSSPPQYILVDGRYIDCCFELIMDLKKLGSQVILDAGSANPGVLKILPHADIIIGSKKFALHYSELNNIEDAFSALKDKYKHLIITMGDEGAKYSLDGDLGSFPAEKVKVLNSNGAGDVFHGAFIAGLANNLSLQECGKVATRVASWHCTQENISESLKKLGSSQPFSSFL